MEAPRRSGRFNLPFVHKSSSFDLTEPEEVKLFKSSQEVVMEERGEKERSRSFDVQDLSSSPRPRLPAGAQPPKRLSLAYGPGELSKALQALMSLHEQSDSEVKSDSSEDEECSLKKKEKRRDRSRHRRSFLSLLLRRTASDKRTR
ncbi:uncharacterized protein ACA1_214920 [Acanthamoeba castellanii str. Neff]|uniref:Uncharacterized protein n=1 Tax=Acanthamoeba castellanii (strain ATCC 30010 / Neff) TaxID=1257118 RepID=L8GQZ5_ACACF|nr:uncharacterized protein ACA1_214920 [Acanthamoeba castellanii str. Neff]ELR15063.1 hypothetical protein ACA1_214920 [Acanthamoeba castellanii str. Neff]